MKQHEAVIQVMEESGGYATLGSLYQHVLKVPGVEWKTKTPFASIRRIVQDERFFFKIKPGLWALKTWRDRLPVAMLTDKRPTPAQLDFSHSYYQGLLVEIGNLKEFQTFVPAQDKNRLFMGQDKLGSKASLSTIYPFCYSEIVDRAKTIDVIWFNSRRLPDSVFEVEHSTDMKNALVKFVELQDFRTNMVIVADQARRPHLKVTLSLNAFEPIRSYVSFWSYEKLAEHHSLLFKLKATGSDILNGRRT
jgi:hypothetical protein